MHELSAQMQGERGTQVVRARAEAATRHDDVDAGSTGPERVLGVIGCGSKARHVVACACTESAGRSCLSGGMVAVVETSGHLFRVLSSMKTCTLKIVNFSS